VVAIRLNDAQIREALLRKLAKQKAAPRAVFEELHVHNGNAIADVVTLHADSMNSRCHPRAAGIHAPQHFHAIDRFSADASGAPADEIQRGIGAISTTNSGLKVVPSWGWPRGLPRTRVCPIA
jgi:hypothetical protein